MAVTPTGAMGVRMAAVETLLASSATFQALVGVDGKLDPATEAPDYIHIGFEDDETVPPFAVIGFDNDVTRTVASTAPNDYDFFGGAETVVTLLAPILEENKDSKADAFYDFDNKTEAIVDEVSAISQSTGKLVITKIRMGMIMYAKAEEARGFRGWFMQRTIRITA